MLWWTQLLSRARSKRTVLSGRCVGCPVGSSSFLFQRGYPGEITEGRLARRFLAIGGDVVPSPNEANRFHATIIPGDPEGSKS